MEAIVVTKIGSLMAMAVLSSLSALIPLRLSKTTTTTSQETSHATARDRSNLLRVLLNFSGGVLLATCFLHLIPDVQEEFQRGSDGLAINQRFPFAELTICLGFFAVYGIEELVEYTLCRSCEQKHHHHDDGSSQGDVAFNNATNHSEHRPRKHEDGVNHECVDTESGLTTSPPPSNSKCFSPLHSNHGGHRQPHAITDDCRRYKNKKSAEQHPLLTESSGGGNSDAEVEAAVAAATQSKRMTSVNGRDDDKDDGHRQLRGTLRGMMLIVGLSFHSIFEGMAIGLQTDVASVFMSFIAVSLHKFIMAFCVGIKLIQVNRNLRFYVACMLTFCLMSPAGIAVGTAVTAVSAQSSSADDGGGGDMTVAALQGLAIGTLIYVTFFEVLVSRNSDKQQPPSLLNFLAVFGGFIIIAGFQVLDDSHQEAAATTVVMETAPCDLKP